MTAPIDPDPIAILLDEHVAAMARFGELDDALAIVQDVTSEHRVRTLDLARRMLDFLNAELEVHIRKEEEPLFPRLKAALPADDCLVDEMIAEHDQIRMKREHVRVVLDEMLTGDDHAAFRAQRAAFANALAATGRAVGSTEQFRLLRRAWRSAFETLRIHFQNEEEIAFPLAQELLSAEELAAAGVAMITIDEEQVMTERPDRDTRPSGETTGSAHRPAQRLAAPVLTFDLASELAQLKEEPSWLRGDRNAKTLVKEGDFRVVLTAMKAGTTIAQHETAARITIQALAGRLRLLVAGDTTDLATGRLVALDRNIPHAVEAVEESAFLLTLAWHGDGRGTAETPNAG